MGREPERTPLSRRALLGGALAAWTGGALGCGRKSSPPAKDDWEQRAWDFPCRHRAAGSFRPEVGTLNAIALEGERLWVAGSERLVQLEVDGRERLSLAVPFAPRALALDPEGALWLAGGARVARIDGQGTLLSAFDLSGPHVRRAPLLTGIAVSEELFLADAAGRMIHRCGLDGTYLCPIGADATRGGLVVPSPYLSIGLERSGALLVAHLGRRRVERYSPDGALLDSFGEAGIRPGAFSGCCNPVGLWTGPDGLVLTAEKGLGRLTWFSPEGEPLALLGRGVFARASRNLQVCALGFGRVYACDPAPGLIHVFEEA